MSNNMRLLMLGLLGLLLAVKFVVLPIADHQQQQLDDLRVLKQKLAKVKATQQMAGPLQQDLAALGQLKQDFINLLPVTTEHQLYAIQIQQQWQQAFEAEKVRLELFSWDGEQPMAVPGVYQGRLTMRLEGEFAAIARAVLKLEQNSTYLHLVELRQGGSRLALDESASISMSVDVMYRLEANNG